MVHTKGTVNADKSWLICKQQHLEHAEQIFADYPKWYHKKRPKTSWCCQRQNTYIHTHRLRHKYNYVMRTISNIRDDLKPLEDAIRNTFIKALFTGYICNDIEMTLLALPKKFGGMGIIMPSGIYDDEYQNSLKITDHTKMKTIKQEMRYGHDTESKKIQTANKKL